MSRAAASLLVPAVLAVAAAVLVPPPVARSSPAAGRPADTVSRLAEAYESRSLDGVSALMTADFRFHFALRPDASSSYAQGLGRQDELQLASAMFFGGEAAFPRADSIRMTLGAIDESADPEHPDSTRHYRLLVAHAFRMRITFGTGDSAKHVDAGDAADAMQVFHVVRGDAALPPPGESADSTRWYVRRWLEGLGTMTVSLGRVEGECGGNARLAESPRDLVPVVPGLRAVNAPLCPTLKVLCDLPGPEPATLEVYDPQGRRLARRTVSVHAAGATLVEAGGGKRFAPGVYWVRLAQGARPAVTKMVVVAL